MAGAVLRTTGSKATSRCFLRGMGIEDFLHIKDSHLEYIEAFVDKGEDIDNGRFDPAARDNRDDVSQTSTRASGDNHVFEEDFLNIYDFDSDSFDDADDDDDDRGKNEEVARAFQVASRPKTVDLRLNPNSPVFVPRQTHFVPRSVQMGLDRRAQRQEVSLDQTDPAIPEGSDANREDQEETGMNDLDRSEQTTRAKRESSEKYYWQLPEVVAREEAALNVNVNRAISPEEKQSWIQRGSSETQQRQYTRGRSNTSSADELYWHRPEVVAREQTYLTKVRSRGSSYTAPVRSLAALARLPRSERGLSPLQHQYLPDKAIRIDNDDVAEDIVVTGTSDSKKRRKNPSPNDRIIDVMTEPSISIDLAEEDQQSSRRRRRRRNPHRQRRGRGSPAEDQFRPIYDVRKTFSRPDDPFRLSPLDRRGISSPGSKKQNELTLHQKKGIRFFSPVELELQEKMARRREKVDEDTDEEFELFKKLADLSFEAEPVKDRYTLNKFLVDSKC